MSDTSTKTQANQAQQKAGQAADKGREAAGHAGEAISHAASAVGQAVSQKASDAASAVASKAGDVASTVAHKVGDAASAVGHKAEDATATVGHSMQSLADKVRDNAPSEGMLGTASRGVAGALDSAGKYVEDRNLSGMMEDVTSLIKRNPIPALLLGLGVGFLIGRALSSSSSSRS